MLGVCTLDLGVLLRQPLLRHSQAPHDYQAYTTFLPIEASQESRQSLPESSRENNQIGTRICFLLCLYPTRLRLQKRLHADHTCCRTHQTSGVHTPAYLST